MAPFRKPEKGSAIVIFFYTDKKSYMQGISDNSMSCRSSEGLWQNIVKTPQEYLGISRGFGKIML